jgi:hypothetical protein
MAIPPHHRAIAAGRPRHRHDERAARTPDTGICPVQGGHERQLDALADLAGAGRREQVGLRVGTLSAGR